MPENNLTFVEKISLQWDHLLQIISKQLMIVGKDVWASRVYLISILIIYASLWHTDQGQDLLVSITEKRGHVLAFYLCIFLLASQNWFWSGKLFLQRKYGVLTDLKSIHFIWETPYINPEPSKSDYRKSIPRFLGILTFLVASGGLLNTYGVQLDDSKFTLIAHISLLAASLFYIVLMTPRIHEFIYTWFAKRKGRIYVAVIISVALFLFMILLSFNSQGEDALKWFSLGVFLASVVFYIYVTLRSVPHSLPFKFLEKIRSFFRLTFLIFFTSLVMSCFFLVANCWPSTAETFGPMALAFSGLVFYILVISFIMFQGQIRKIQFLTISLLLLWALYFFSSNDLYEIRYAQTTEINRLSLEDYITQWVEHREVHLLALPKSETYPVFIVYSYGGGSRAAYWSNLVNSSLQDKSKKQYADHLFAMSGASGGAFGNSAFVSFLHADLDSLRSCASKVHGGDFLSASLAKLLGSDLWQAALPGFHIGGNRGTTLEKQWEERVANASATENKVFEMPFEDIWYKNGRPLFKVPLLFANTTNSNSGKRGITTPIKMGTEFTDAIDLIEEVRMAKEDNSTLYLSTATLLCARFPYINPSGKVSGVGQFVDGGYFDNSAALTAFEIYSEFQKVIRKKAIEIPDSANPFAKLELHIIGIHNDPKSSEDTSSQKRPKQLSEFIIPFNTILNLQASHTNYADVLIKNSVPNPNYHRFNLTRQYITPGLDWEEIRPVMPLGRYISRNAMMAMEHCLDNEKNVKDAFSEVLDLLEK